MVRYLYENKNYIIKNKLITVWCQFGILSCVGGMLYTSEIPCEKMNLDKVMHGTTDHLNPNDSIFGPMVELVHVKSRLNPKKKVVTTNNVKNHESREIDPAQENNKDESVAITVHNDAINQALRFCNPGSHFSTLADGGNALPLHQDLVRDSDFRSDRNDLSLVNHS